MKHLFASLQIVFFFYHTCCWPTVPPTYLWPDLCSSRCSCCPSSSRNGMKPWGSWRRPKAFGRLSNDNWQHPRRRMHSSGSFKLFWFCFFSPKRLRKSAQHVHFFLDSDNLKFVARCNDPDYRLVVGFWCTMTQYQFKGLPWVLSSCH